MGTKKSAKADFEDKKIPKEISQEIFKKVFKNIVIAAMIILYFFILNIAHEKMQLQRLIGDIKIFSGTFLVLGIIFIEQAYKSGDGYRAVHGIEMLVLSGHTLSAMHIISMFKYDFRVYMLTSSYIIAIYYVFKSIVIYTIGKKQYLDDFSDISEIVKDEPLKKEAKKRRNIETQNKKPKTKKNKKTTNNKKSNKSKTKGQAKKEQSTTKNNNKNKRKKMTGTRVKSANKAKRMK